MLFTLYFVVEIGPASVQLGSLRSPRDAPSAAWPGACAPRSAGAWPPRGAGVGGSARGPREASGRACRRHPPSSIFHEFSNTTQLRCSMKVSVFFSNGMRAPKQCQILQGFAMFSKGLEVFRSFLARSEALECVSIFGRFGDFCFGTFPDNC